MAKLSIKRLRLFVYNNLQNDDHQSTFSLCVNYFLIFLIVGNVAAVILESITELYLAYQVYFDMFENISIALFIEYVLRLWSIVEKEPSLPASQQRLKWMRSGELLSTWLQSYLLILISSCQLIYACCESYAC
jgi:voltage-gated potassium channel